MAWFAAAMAHRGAADKAAEGSWEEGESGGWGSRVLDPGGWHGGRGLFGAGGVAGSGWDPFGWSKKPKEPEYANTLERLRAENPALLAELEARAAGQGASAAEELSKAQTKQATEGMLGLAASGPGAYSAGALRGAMRQGANFQLDAQQQLNAMRAQEQHAAQQMLLDAMMKGASLEDAMAMFNAEMAYRREQQRNAMMAQAGGAALSAFAAYQQSQSGGGFGEDWAAAGNLGAGGGARMSEGERASLYGSGTNYDWGTSAPGDFPTTSEGMA